MFATQTPVKMVQIVKATELERASAVSVRPGGLGLCVRQVSHSGIFFIDCFCCCFQTPHSPVCARLVGLEICVRLVSTACLFMLLNKEPSARESR